MGGIGQANGLDKIGKSDGALQLQDSHIVVISKVVEVWVANDLLDIPFLNIAVAPVALVVKSHECGPELGIVVPARSLYMILRATKT